MSTNVDHPSVQTLRKLTHLADLDRPQLEELASRIQVLTAPRGTSLVKLGSQDDTVLYLLEGELNMKSSDGHKFTIRATDRAAASPLCRLRPARYTCQTRNTVKYLCIDNSIFDDYASFDDASSLLADDSYLINEPSQDIDARIDDSVLVYRIFDDLNRGRLLLPSLPDIALKVGRAAQMAGRDSQKISQALMVDPAIAIKAIKAINTHLISNQAPVKTCAEAVERLGPKKTMALVVKCVLCESAHFQSPVAVQHMQQWWEKSIKASAISYVLARLDPRFDPEFAALAGLLHNIGELAILSYSNEFSELQSAPSLEASIAANKAEVGRVLLTSWNLSHELVVSAAESGNWMREHNNRADYADIALIANMHALIGVQHSETLPAIHESPAFKRLGLGDVSPKFSLKILEAARTAIHQTESALAA